MGIVSKTSTDCYTCPRMTGSYSETRYHVMQTSEGCPVSLGEVAGTYESISCAIHGSCIKPREYCSDHPEA